MAPSSLLLLCLISLSLFLAKSQSPATKASVCDDYYSCPQKTTCCCVLVLYGECFAWGCCPLEGATCCEDQYSCCPHEYPICNVRARTCSMSKNNPLGVKAMRRTPATPVGTGGKGGRKNKIV